jgi:hypothetical protein
MTDNETKKIYITGAFSRRPPPPPPPPPRREAGPTKKKKTTMKKWTIRPEELVFENQWKLLCAAVGYYSAAVPAPVSAPAIAPVPAPALALALALAPPTHYNLIIQHIHQKLYSYKTQDILKKKYNIENFVNIKTVFELLMAAEMKCYYCKKHVMLLYEYIREPMQWSLDRIDNSIGHNHNNLYIACLSCNLRRRCIFPERYVVTQQCKTIIKLQNNNIEK